MGDQGLGDERQVLELSGVVEPVLTTARSQGVEVHGEVSGDLTVYGHWVQIAQVLQNLVENARRHAPGSPVTVRAAAEGGRVLIRVEDRGPGIGADERASIMGRAQRGLDAATRPGRGLGLYVSARFVADQGGHLWVEDREGGGACFVVALPTGPQAPWSVPARGEPFDQVDELFDAGDLQGLGPRGRRD